MSKGGSPNAALDDDLPAQLGSLGRGGHFSAGLRSWTGSQDLRRDSSQWTTNDRASLFDSVARIALTSQLRLPGLVDACPGLCCGLVGFGSISNRVNVDDDSRPWFLCTGASPSPIYRDGISEMIEPRGMDPGFRGCLARYSSCISR